MISFKSCTDELLRCSWDTVVEQIESIRRVSGGPSDIGGTAPVDMAANDDMARTSAQLPIWIAVIITSATAQRKAASKNSMARTSCYGVPFGSETLMDTQCVPGTNSALRFAADCDGIKGMNRF